MLRQLLLGPWFTLHCSGNFLPGSTKDALSTLPDSFLGHLADTMGDGAGSSIGQSVFTKK